LHKCAPFLLFSLAGFLFSNPVNAQYPLSAGTGQNLTAPPGTFTITQSNLPGILFAHDGGTIITAPGGLAFIVTGSNNTGLGATGTDPVTGTPSKITADGVVLSGAGVGASVDNGGTISITGGTFNVTKLGLGVGTGSINATDLFIVLEAPTPLQNPPQIGAAVLSAGGTLTLHGGFINDNTPGGGGLQSIGLRAANGATLIADGTIISGGFHKSAEASTGGHIELFNLSITQNFATPPGTAAQHGALEVSGGGTISGENIHITTSQFDELGAFAQGGTIVLKNNTIGKTTIETTGDSGAGIWAENATFGPIQGRQSTIDADNVLITTSGQAAYGAIALFGGIVNLNSSTITTTGKNANGVYSFFGSTVNVTGSTVTAEKANAGQVVDHSVMNITNSTLTGGTNGIRISDDVHDLGPSTLIVSSSTITATAAGAGEAAFRVDGAEANITLNSVTVKPGAQNLLLNVTSIDRAGTPFDSVVNFTVNSSTLTGNILVDPSTVTINLNNSILNGIINGATDVNLSNSSTWNTPDDSTILGHLVLSQSALNFISAPKFATTGQASVLTIKGNFQMDSKSSLSVGVGGLNGSQYDHLLVGGNINLRGTLVVNSLNNFRPSNGNFFEIINSKSRTPTPFDGVTDNLNTNPKLTRVDIYAPNGAAIAYVATAGPSPAPPIIDVIPTPLPPIEPNRPLSLSFLLQILNPTVEQLTSMFEISISGANTQRFNLTDRMTQIQRGSTGFVSPISPVHHRPLPAKTLGKKEVIPPVFTPGPTNRWGVWVNGWGDWVSVDSDNSIKGYDFTTGGVSVGLDYRITNCLAVGIFGTYAHTWTSLSPGDVDVNTGRGGVYATYWNHGFYVNGGIYGGYNSYDTSRQTLLQGRLANGDTEGYEFSTFVDTGYDFHFGNLSVGPVFAAQYTNVHVDGFTEHGAFLPLNIHGDSEESWRTDLGVQASYTWHVGNIIVIPSLWAAWDHEYKYNRLPVTFSSVVFPGVSATTFGPHEGHDSAIINAGVGTQWTARISTYVGYQGQLGRDNYSANGVTGTISFSF